MVRQRQNIPLTEVWVRDDWTNFDTYKSVTDGLGLGRQAGAYPFGLSTQRHIDVRTFLEGIWGAATTGYQSAYNNWPGAQFPASIGTTTYTSAYTTPIDLTTLGPGTLLTMAMPDFPGGDIDLTQSAIELSHNGFGTVCHLAWSDSTTNPTSDHRLSFPYAMLTGIDLTKVSHVRFVITATVNTTVVAFALRLIDVNWVPTNVDFASLDGQLRQCIPLDADNTSVIPANRTLPLMWRAADPPGLDDPQPINAEFGFVFNTGSQTLNNSFSLFMRELSKAFITQIDLQDTPQEDLSDRPQPISGISDKLPRPMLELDQQTMDGLDAQSMHNLEAMSNPVYSSWVKFTVNWGLTPSVQITNSGEPSEGFQYYGMTFEDNTSYLAVCSLSESNAQLQIYNVNQTTFAMEDRIFDTTLIPDTFFFPRRAGRIGFQAQLQDGDAFIGPIRPRRLMFAEYRSAPLRSITPVRGARLYAQATPPLELFKEWNQLADGDQIQPQLAIDRQRFVTTDTDQQSTKVTVTTPSGSLPVQGIISNTLSPDAWSGITDFDELHLQFSVWMPSAAINSGLEDGHSILTAELLGGSQGATSHMTMRYPSPDLYPYGTLFPGVDMSDIIGLSINLPAIKPDQWQTISIHRPLPKPYPMSGLYRFALLYHGSSSATWWVDNVSVHEHVVRWDARSVVNDPWHSNEAPWTYFHETINSNTDGVHFTTQGTDLQLRGQALRQGVAMVGAPKLVPQYAELGKLVWDEERVAMPALPTATINTIRVGRLYQFSLSAVSAGVANYGWSFGDGAFASGPVASHTYDPSLPAGTEFTVYLTLHDQMGQANLVTASPVILA